MFRNILVALDGSSHGQIALEQAVALAKRLEGRVHGIHILDTSVLRGSLLYDFSGALGLEPQTHLKSAFDRFMHERAASLFQAAEEQCAREGVTCQTSSRPGEVAEALAEAAEREDLIVLGRRGAAYDANQQREAGHGSVLRLIKLSTTPVLLTGLTVSRLEHPLVLFDASPGAFRALMDATRFAGPQKLPLAVCYVQEPGSTESTDPLVEARSYLEPYRIEASFTTLEGTVRESVAGYLDEIGGDMAFMGYRGNSRLRELFVGRTPAVLMRRIPCPLWVSK